MSEIVAAVRKDSVEVRRAVIEACRFLSKAGFTIGTWGNVSVRVEEGLLITPSRLGYDVMRPDDLVVIAWTGERVGGHRLPSSEVELHRLLLAKRPDLGALVHVHSPYLSTLACARRSLPVFVEEVAQIVGGQVNCTPYVPGGHHLELAKAACEALAPSSSAVLLANHGAVVGGRDLAEALVACQVLEKAAMMYVNAAPLGGCAALPATSVAEERHRYLYKYGTPEDAAAEPASGCEGPASTSREGEA